MIGLCELGYARGRRCLSVLAKTRILRAINPLQESDPSRLGSGTASRSPHIRKSGESGTFSASSISVKSVPLPTGALAPYHCLYEFTRIEALRPSDVAAGHGDGEFYTDRLPQA